MWEQENRRSSWNKNSVSEKNKSLQLPLGYTGPVGKEEEGKWCGNTIYKNNKGHKQQDAMWKQEIKYIGRQNSLLSSQFLLKSWIIPLATLTKEQRFTSNDPFGLIQQTLWFRSTRPLFPSIYCPFSVSPYSRQETLSLSPVLQHPTRSCRIHLF